MENTIEITAGNNLPTIAFRKRYNLNIIVYRYDCDKTVRLLRANKYTVTFIFEEKEKTAIITVANVSLCGAATIRNLIKNIMIYD